MKHDNLRNWMEQNRHSSYSFSKALLDKHGLKVSPETVQRWMRGSPVTERYRAAVRKETKLRFDTNGKIRPASFLK